MKKLALLLISVLTLAVIPLSSVSAMPRYTDVSGTVYYGRRTVNNVQILVKCGSQRQWTSTNKHGMYNVEFNSWQCNANSRVNVIGSKGSKQGDDWGTVNKHDSAYVDVYMWSNVAVDLPEFSPITGIAATILGAGIFLIIRRHKLSAKAD
jgi:hypothetical protein